MSKKPSSTLLSDEMAAQSNTPSRETGTAKKPSPIMKYSNLTEAEKADVRSLYSKPGLEKYQHKKEMLCDSIDNENT